MKFILGTTLLVILLFIKPDAMNAQVQNLNPLTLAKKIMAKDSFPAIQAYCTGEYKGKPNGQNIPERIERQFILLEQKEKYAVVNISLVDTNGKAFDTYMHFSKGKVWKVKAFRALAMTGIVEKVYNQLSKMKSNEVDSIIALSARDKSESYFSSRAEYEFELGNTGLTIASDNELIEHLKKNEKLFNLLIRKAKNKLKSIKKEEDRATNVGEGLEKELKEIFISSIRYGGWEFENAYNFFIGGMIDNTVGYLYIEKAEDIPEMSADRIIMIRHIQGNWYLYKTT